MRQQDLSEQCLLSVIVNADLGIPVKYENAGGFVKPTSSPWAAVHYMPNVPDPVTAGTYGYDEASGLLQIDINVPLNAGTKQSRDLVDKIVNLFPSGHDLMYNDAWVRPRRVGRTQGREVDGWWRVSVTVYWYTRLQRLGV